MMAKIEAVDPSSSLIRIALWRTPATAQEILYHPAANDTSALPNSTIFAGPLRPAVRHLTVAVNDPSDAPIVEGFLVQDWCCSSFLRALPARSRVVALNKKVEEEDRLVVAEKANKRMEFSNLMEEMKRTKEREVTVPRFHLLR